MLQTGKLKKVSRKKDFFMWESGEKMYKARKTFLESVSPPDGSDTQMQKSPHPKCMQKWVWLCVTKTPLSKPDRAALGP